MPLNLDIKKKLTTRSDRVKSVELHPTEPWMLVSLYNGSVVIWNHESQTSRTFDITNVPIRCARFIPRKNWFVCGSDDNTIRVYNYNTAEKVHQFEAHADYIRVIVVHPTLPYILTASDDMSIKLWDWDKRWSLVQTFEGHTHYVLQAVINPKDNNQFASGSMDRTIKVWSLGCSAPNFTMEGHQKGVNCVDYFHGGDKPYIISGADDFTVKIWDYQNKSCIQTLTAHSGNVTAVAFHPELPIIITGSEDRTLRIWHANTYKLESTLDYNMERIWCIACMKGTNDVAIGYDEGSIMIKLGREDPALSMDSGGKIMFARHNRILQANIKAVRDVEVKDGERLPLPIKECDVLCDIFPQTLLHSPNGRFVAAIGDGEFIIYTSLVLKNVSFGAAQDFVWAPETNEFAILEGARVTVVSKNFQDRRTLKSSGFSETPVGLCGGHLLGVKFSSSLVLYDWESFLLIRRIEIQPQNVYWSSSGELLCVTTKESFFILRYKADCVDTASESRLANPDDGFEDAFDVLGQYDEIVKAGLWQGDCFIYTTNTNRVNYYVGGEIVTITHLERTMYLLGYIAAENKLYLADKDLAVISYALHSNVLLYQTAVMRKDFDAAKEFLPKIPHEQRNRVAHFLVKQGYKQQALVVSCDIEHKFELAAGLGDVNMAYQLACESESEHKWKQLAELAINKFQFDIAKECLLKARDFAGLLVLAVAAADFDGLALLSEMASKSGKNNVAFLANYLIGNVDSCVKRLEETNRLPEACFMARVFAPSKVSPLVKAWKDNVSTTSQKIANALADPEDYMNLFPEMEETKLAEMAWRESLQLGSEHNRCNGDNTIKEASIQLARSDIPHELFPDDVASNDPDGNLEDFEIGIDAYSGDIELGDEDVEIEDDYQ